MSGLYSAIGAIGGSLLGGVFGGKSAKTQAAAAAQDQRQTTVDTQSMQQLMQEIAKMDKNVAEQLFGTSNTNDIMNSLQQLQGQQQQQETTTQTTERGGAETNAALSNALGQVSSGMGNGDANFQAAMQQVLRSGMPAVANVGNRSGTYGDTTTALLQNDLAVKAAEAGVGAQQQQQSQSVSQLAQLAQALQGGKEQTTGTGQSTATNTQTNNTQQNNQSNTTTTQDRTAQETAQNQTSQGTTVLGQNSSDTFIDFGKDTSLDNKNILANLGRVTNQGFQSVAPVSLPAEPGGQAPNLEQGLNPINSGPVQNPNGNYGVVNPINGGAGGQMNIANVLRSLNLM